MPAVEESSDTTCKRLKVKNKRSSILLFDRLSVFHDLSLGLSIVGYTSSAFREITRLYGVRAGNFLFSMSTE